MDYRAITQQIEIRVEVAYVPADHRRTEVKPRVSQAHFWAYHITMINHGSHEVQLVSRHWTITDGLGEQEIVEGPGVIGLTPTIKPGQSFDYSSGCPLETSSGTMHGYYLFKANDDTFRVEIPAFSLDLPASKRTLN